MERNNNNTSPQSNLQRQPGEAPNLSVILTIRLLMQGKEVGSIIGKVRNTLMFLFVIFPL